MNAREAAAWQRIRAFRFDAEGAPHPFSAKLAQQSRWDRRYATRVIAEYRKFIFLMVCDPDGQNGSSSRNRDPVTPSTDVDLAWHLHMIYTRSYWDDLCRDALGGRKLHHDPSEGGTAAREQYVELYESTLALYSRKFGVPPPADIWPPASDRFREKLVTVDTSRAWVVQAGEARNLAKRAAAGFACLSGLIAAVSGSALLVASDSTRGPVPDNAAFHDFQSRDLLSQDGGETDAEGGLGNLTRFAVAAALVFSLCLSAAALAIGPTIKNDKKRTDVEWKWNARYMKLPDNFKAYGIEPRSDQAAVAEKRKQIHEAIGKMAEMIVAELNSTGVRVLHAASVHFDLAMSRNQLDTASDFIGVPEEGIPILKAAIMRGISGLKEDDAFKLVSGLSTAEVQFVAHSESYSKKFSALKRSLLRRAIIGGFVIASFSVGAAIVLGIIFAEIGAAVGIGVVGGVVGMSIACCAGFIHPPIPNEAKKILKGSKSKGTAGCGAVAAGGVVLMGAGCGGAGCGGGGCGGGGCGGGGCGGGGCGGGCGGCGGCGG